MTSSMLYTLECHITVELPVPLSKLGYCHSKPRYYWAYSLTKQRWFKWMYT